MKELNEFARKVNNLAHEKGWHDKPRTFGDIIALCHAELSEALEDYRNGYIVNETFMVGEKPCGIPIELADCIIRILDFCGEEEIDIEAALKLKHDYNQTRPHRHGGKIL